MAHQAQTDILRTVPIKPGWSFYLTWIILTFLSLPIAFFLTFVILKGIIIVIGDIIFVDGVRHITEDFLFIYIFAPVAGLVTGVLQYFLLRWYLPRVIGWIFATAGGWSLGVLLVSLPGWLNWTNVFLNRIDLNFIVIGLLIGLLQWLLLRRRLFRAGWWIVANLVGWGLLALVTPGNQLGQFGLFTVGLIPACATAGCFALLMKQQVSDRLL